MISHARNVSILDEPGRCWVSEATRSEPENFRRRRAGVGPSRAETEDVEPAHAEDFDAIGLEHPVVALTLVDGSLHLVDVSIHMHHDLTSESRPPQVRSFTTR